MRKIPEGQLYLHTDKSAINTDINILDASERADRMNTSDYLYSTFFGENSRIIYKDSFPSGGKISLLYPNAPYSHESIMVIAAGPNSFINKDVSTQNIYDLPLDVQRAYWSYIKTCLQVIEDETDKREDRDRFHIFATENCMFTRTTSKTRTSRSIALPHSQILRLDEQSLKPSNKKISHLIFEQRILKMRYGVERFIEKLYEHSEKITNFKLPEISARSEYPPFGYQFIPSSVNDIDEIVNIMKVHHIAYRNSADEMILKLKPNNKEKIIIQPSYRVYMFFQDNKFSVIISPEFISHAGVMEAAGVNLQRSSEYPEIPKSEDFLNMINKIISHLEKNKNSLSSI